MCTYYEAAWNENCFVALGPYSQKFEATRMFESLSCVAWTQNACMIPAWFFFRFLFLYIHFFYFSLFIYVTIAIIVLFFFFFCGISVSASMWIRDASPHSTKGWLCYSWLYGLGCHFKLSWLSVHWQSARKWQPSGVTFPIIENNRKQLYLTLRDTTGSRTRLSPSLCGTSLIILDT